MEGIGSRPVGRNTKWTLIGGVLVAHLLTWALLCVLKMPIQGHDLIRDGAVLVLPMVSLPLAFRARNRFAMWLGGVSAFALVGQLVWIVERHGFQRTQDPSVATPIWFLTYLMVILAVFRWPARQFTGKSISQLLESLMVGSGVFALGWVYVLGPKLRSWPMVDVGTGLDIAYFLIDVLLVIGLAQALRRGIDPRYRSSTALGVMAIGIITLTDLTDLTSATSVWLRDLPVIGWSLGVSLCNIAAYIFAKEAMAAKEEAMRPARSQLGHQVPYLALLPVGALLLRVTQDPDLWPYEFGVKLCALLLTAALGLRQYLALRDNEELITNLQEAKDALGERNEELSRTRDDLTELLERIQEKNEELAHANEQLARLVTVDGMTGLGNHRAFHERLRLEVEAARRFGHPLAVLIADLDHFRRYNDEFGHPAGDELLRQVAKSIYDSVDLKAYPARYGGEEFAVVLPYASTQEAIDIAQRIGASIQRIGSKRPITVSVGIAGTQNNQYSSETLVEEAFRALITAKERGRNQILLAEDLERRCLTLNLNGGEDLSIYEPTEPMGLAAILSAALRSHPQALTLEPEAQLVSGLLGTLELKDLETRDHSERVMWYALRLAQSVIETDAAQMTQQELRSLAYGALLHDIGKIGVPETILKFPGKLTEEMRNVIREHPRLGAQLVMKFPSLEMALPVIRFHHERWDGTGYPNGKHRRDIPLVARIFAVVDALEALTSQRPYKDPMPIEQVTNILIADSGSHFDPAIVDAYLAVPMAEWMRIREMEHHLSTTVFTRPAA